MTKKETELIKKAIRHIHNDDEYFSGMNILAKMVGWKTIEFPKKTISVSEVEKMIKLGADNYMKKMLKKVAKNEK